MTISTTTRKVSYTGTGADTPLSTVFPFFEASDLGVQQRVTATGALTLLTLGVHYSVTLASSLPGVGTVTPLNGAVDFTAAMTWTIVRTTDITQNVDYVENDSFPAESHEAALDRLTIIAQENAETGSRSLRFPESDDPALDPRLPASTERASKILTFDSSGKPAATAITAITPTTVVMSALGIQIAEIANEPALQTLLGYLGALTNLEFVEVGTIGAIPVAGTGVGLYYATDERAFYYSNGAAWSDRLSLIEIGNYANLPTTLFQLGISADRGLQLYMGNGALAVPVRSLPPRYIAGFQMSCTGNDELTIGAGSCRNLLFTGAGNAADQMNLITTSALAKDASAAWVVGAAGGMLPNGVAYAAGWYHVFAIVKGDGTVDFALDTDAGATAILADVGITGAGYQWARRIGSIQVSAAANILEFIQKGDTFLWKDPTTLAATLDLAISNGDHTAGATASLENVPPGVVVEAILNLQTAGGSGPGFLVSSGLVSSVAPSATVPPLANVTGGNPDYDTMRILTDGATPPLIRYRALTDTSMSLGISAVGWVDNRGKDY